MVQLSVCVELQCCLQFARSDINPFNSLLMGLRKRRERDILNNQVLTGQGATVLS